MNHIAISTLLVAALLAAAPAVAQIVAPVLEAPPCKGTGCLSRVRNIPAQPASQVCPAGTVYNPQKGTCKVLPPPH